MAYVPRCGDYVHHKPTGQRWKTAYADRGYFGWCGYPAGEVKLGTVTVVYRCSDQEHLACLDGLISAGEDSKRRRLAKEALEQFRLRWVGDALTERFADRDAAKRSATSALANDRPNRVGRHIKKPLPVSMPSPDA